MNRTEVKLYNQLIEDFANDKIIEYQNSEMKWVECEVLDFTYPLSKYRLKPNSIWSRRYYSTDDEIKVSIWYCGQSLINCNYSTMRLNTFIEWIDPVWTEYKLPFKTYADS